MHRSGKLVRCEVISVACSQFVTSSKRQAFRYERGDGAVLAKGYYLAVWPAGACRSSYGREVRYFGPYGTEAVARMVQVSALALGIVESGADGVDKVVPGPAKVNHDYRRQGLRAPISELGILL